MSGKIERVGDIMTERDNLREVNALLLAALESLVDRCHHFGGSKGGKMDLTIARAAIRRAKGE